MKLYNSVGPNPQVVRVFVHEKAMQIPVEEVDIRAGDNRQADYMAINPSGTTPCLELDDGQRIAEITTICEYLEELQPEPPLIGSTAQERAETRMWVRRIDLGICEPLTSGFRYSEGLPMFKDRMLCLPEAADGLKEQVRQKLSWLDALLADRQFVCGDRFTLADIMLYCFVTFGGHVGQPVPEACQHIHALLERIGSRDSARA